MTSASTGAAPSSWRARFAGGAAVRLESLIVLAVLCVTMAMLSNAFLSVSNILNILLSTSVFGVLAIGMTFVISSAGHRPLGRIDSRALGRRRRDADLQL